MITAILPAQDHIGNFIESKIRQPTYKQFELDPLIYAQISVHTNIEQLNIMEALCDHYLEYWRDETTIHKLLEFRDHVIMRIQKLQREARMRDYVRIHRYNNVLQGYSHSLQYLLPTELQLTCEQINQGYIPRVNEPIEYVCGCLTMCYHVPCECCQSYKGEIKLCDNECCNEKIYPELRCVHICENHKVQSCKKEISSINYFNMRAKKRISKFPWKNGF